ncbi:transposase [Streptomyces spinosus]|uniref:transposase n=1 Tax=Streptomyces spinosus TaxID=2872623 RepID=UPI0035568B4C
MGRGDRTNGQWARLEPLLPTAIKPGRPQVWTRRQLIDGIRWRTRTGAPWRDVPERARATPAWLGCRLVAHALGVPCRTVLLPVVELAVVGEPGHGVTTDGLCH